MKDDVFKKIKSILSGSVQLKKDSENNKVDQYDNEEELINSFMNQILDASWLEEDLKKTFAPSYHLSDKQKSYWLLNTHHKILFNVKSGVEIIPIEKQDKDKTLCLIGQSTYIVPNDILVCSGWN